MSEPMGRIPAPPASSPLIREFSDNFDKVIRISVFFDVTTRALTGITVFRDAGCQWTRILLGLGDDGTPNSTTRDVPVPEGTTPLTAQQLNRLANRGITTVEEFQAFQITAA